MMSGVSRLLVDRILPALVLGLGTASAHAEEYRHPVGIQLRLPAGWQTGRLGNADLLQPPDASSDEAYVAKVSSAMGSTRADDPRALEKVEAEVQEVFPSFTRVGGVEPIPAGNGGGVLLTWIGRDTDGSVWEARLHFVISGEFSFRLFAIAPREKMAARAATLREIFATFTRGEGERDPALEGNWSFTKSESHRSGELTMVFYRKVQAAIHPDGRFEAVESSGYVGGDMSNAFDNEERSQARGRWYAGRGVFYLLLEDGSHAEVDYGIDGAPGGRRIVFRPLLAGMSHLDEPG